jgi:hypothetical protein
MAIACPVRVHRAGDQQKPIGMPIGLDLHRFFTGSL